MKFIGFLGRSRIPMQVDIGFGDIMHPAAIDSDYPVVLPDMPVPRLRTYPRESVIAEKFQAMVYLGTANRRIKDFFDIGSWRTRSISRASISRKRFVRRLSSAERRSQQPRLPSNLILWRTHTRKLSGRALSGVRRWWTFPHGWTNFDSPCAPSCFPSPRHSKRAVSSEARGKQAVPGGSAAGRQARPLSRSWTE